MKPGIKCLKCGKIGHIAEVKDLMVLEQLVKTLPRDIGIFVVER